MYNSLIYYLISDGLQQVKIQNHFYHFTEIGPIF